MIEPSQESSALGQEPVTVRALIAPDIPTDSPYQMRLWYLRCAQRNLQFSRGVLLQGLEDALRGEASPAVAADLKRAWVSLERALGPLRKQLRQLHSSHSHHWVSWSRKGPTHTVLHGEEHTLIAAQEAALRGLREIEGLHFHQSFSEADAVALVTGPRGARYELRRTYHAKRGYQGFKWQRGLRATSPDTDVLFLRASTS